MPRVTTQGGLPPYLTVQSIADTPTVEKHPIYWTQDSGHRCQALLLRMHQELRS